MQAWTRRVGGVSVCGHRGKEGLGLDARLAGANTSSPPTHAPSVRENGKSDCQNAGSSRSVIFSPNGAPLRLYGQTTPHHLSLTLASSAFAFAQVLGVLYTVTVDGTYLGYASMPERRTSLPQASISRLELHKATHVSSVPAASPNRRPRASNKIRKRVSTAVPHTASTL